MQTLLQTLPHASLLRPAAALLTVSYPTDPQHMWRELSQDASIRDAAAGAAAKRLSPLLSPARRSSPQSHAVQLSSSPSPPPHSRRSSRQVRRPEPPLCLPPPELLCSAGAVTGPLTAEHNAVLDNPV